MRSTFLFSSSFLVRFSCFVRANLSQNISDELNSRQRKYYHSLSMFFFSHESNIFDYEVILVRTEWPERFFLYFFSFFLFRAA